MWGAWWAGLVVVPINAKLHAKEAAWIVEHSGARLSFVSDDVGRDLPAELRRVGVDTPAYAALFAPPAMAIESRAGPDLAWLSTPAAPPGARRARC